jgi:ketosteroid isomerase-like protein
MPRSYARTGTRSRIARGGYATYKPTTGEDAMGEGDGKVKQVISSAKRRVGAEAPVAAEDDDSTRVGVVRGALKAFGQGEMDAFCDALKDDVMWENPEGENFPGSGDLSGPGEVRERFIGDVGRTYTSFGFRPESFLETDQEDAVVVIGRFEGEAVEGDNVDTPGVQVWGFKGSEVTHVRVFADTAAFPEVVTEQKEKEWAEEEKKKEEEEKKDDSDSDDSDSDDGGKAESNGGSPEGKSDDSDDDDGSGESNDSDDDDSEDKPKAEARSGGGDSDSDSDSDKDES